MKLVVANRPRLRAALLWLTVTAALGGLGALTAPLAADLLTDPGPTFADALTRSCAAAALVAAVALWLAAGEVAWCVLRSPEAASRRSAVGPVRRTLLVACGVSVLATAIPVHAAPGSDTPVGAGAPLGTEALAGLPLPDRPVAAAAATPDVVTVRRGDSLWAIASRRLGPAASQADVASYWLRVQAANADVLGPDPDLIQPGQSLRLPPA